MARLKTILSLKTPSNLLAKYIPEDDPLWSNKQVKRLLDLKEITVQNEDQPSVTVLKGKIFKNLEYLIQNLDHELYMFVYSCGENELICVKEYIKNQPKCDTGVLVREITRAMDTMNKLCQNIFILHLKICKLQSDEISIHQLEKLQESFMKFFKSLLDIRWVNTAIYFGLDVIYDLYAIRAKKRIDNTQNSRTAVQLNWDLKNVFDQVSQLINSKNYKDYLPKICDILLIAEMVPSHTMKSLALAAINASDNIERDKAYILPILRYLVTSASVGVARLTEARYNGFVYSLPNLLPCILRFPKYPTEFEFFTFKCFALLGSISLSAQTDVVRFYPFLFSKSYTAYHSLLLKWLEKIFNNNSSRFLMYKNMCKSFIDSRSFKNFTRIILKHFEQSSHCEKISDELSYLISILSSLTMSFDIKDDLKETLLLVDLYKKNDYFVLNFLLEIYFKLRDEFQLVVQELDTTNEELKLLVSVWQSKIYQYPFINEYNWDEVGDQFAKDIDYLDQMNNRQPPSTRFQKFSLFAKIGSILYWLLREDVDCNDIIKDDIEDLVTPVLTFAKFTIYRSYGGDQDFFENYENWKEFTNEGKDVINIDEEDKAEEHDNNDNDTHDSQDDDDEDDDDEDYVDEDENVYDDPIFIQFHDHADGDIYISRTASCLKQTGEPCTYTALRMLRLIGRLNEVSSRVRKV